MKKITYEEISDVVDPLEAIFTRLTSKTNAFDLVLVGRSRRPTPIVARLLHRHAHCSELGPIGDALVDPQIRASVLVFQQHDPVLQAVHGLSSSHSAALETATPE
ncbi:unnamed protein product [Sphagnum balticum]